MKYKLKKYTDQDYEFVYDTKKVCYQKYVEEYFGGWDDAVQRRMFDELMVKESKHTCIVMINNQMAGFFSDEVDDLGYHINNICLLPEYRSKGVGTSILNDAFSKHKNQDIYLRVFKSNPVQRLYKRLGFEIYDEKKAHYLMAKWKW